MASTHNRQPIPPAFRSVEEQKLKNIVGALELLASALRRDGLPAGWKRRSYDEWVSEAGPVGVVAVEVGIVDRYRPAYLKGELAGTGHLPTATPLESYPSLIEAMSAANRYNLNHCDKCGAYTGARGQAACDSPECIYDYQQHDHVPGTEL